MNAVNLFQSSSDFEPLRITDTYNENISKERIEQLAQGTLKTRPMGKPVYKPTGREKVAQVPMEWEQGSVLQTVVK